MHIEELPLVPETVFILRPRGWFLHVGTLEPQVHVLCPSQKWKNTPACEELKRQMFTTKSLEI